MRRAALILAGLGLAACAPEPPNDGESYFDSITPDPAALIAAEARLALAETGTAQGGPQTVVPPSDTVAPVAAQSAPQPVQTAAAVPSESGTGISDTQDFGAITARETRQSDAQKLAALKQTYQTVEPEALPQRTDGGVNLAAYAISQKHEVGTRVYSRFDRSTNNCQRYRNDPDAAQRAFLQAGGPERDRRQLDPDGDGYACGWTPDTYRRLLSATQGG